MKKLLLASLMLSTIGSSAFAKMSTVENDNPAEAQLKKIVSSNDTENLASFIAFEEDHDTPYNKDKYNREDFFKNDRFNHHNRIEKTLESAEGTTADVILRWGRIELHCPTDYYLPNISESLPNKYNDLSTLSNFGNKKYFEQSLKIRRKKEKNGFHKIAEITIDVDEDGNNRRSLRMLSSEDYRSFDFKFRNELNNANAIRIYCVPKAKVDDYYEFDKIYQSRW